MRGYIWRFGETGSGLQHMRRSGQCFESRILLLSGRTPFLGLWFVSSPSLCRISISVLVLKRVPFLPEYKDVSGKFG
jgi:hypothetical protein